MRRIARRRIVVSDYVLLLLLESVKLPLQFVYRVFKLSFRAFVLLTELSQLPLGQIKLPSSVLGEGLATVLNGLQLLGMRLLVVGKSQVRVLQLLHSSLEVVKMDFHLVLKLDEV